MLRVPGQDDDDDVEIEEEDDEEDMMMSSGPASPESTQAVLDSGNVLLQQQQHVSPPRMKRVLLTATPIPTAQDLVSLSKEQLTIAYATVLAKTMHIQLCQCLNKLRCKVCLNCSDTHCLCRALMKEQQKSSEEQLAAAKPTTPAPAAAAPTEAKQHILIEELAKIFVKPNLSFSNQDFLCSICHIPMNSTTAKGPAVKCQNCSITYHALCLHISHEALPDGPWYCKGCFPLADYIYYPPIKPVPLTVIDKARVIQIIQGEAERLSENAKLAFVEDYVKRFNIGTGTKFFIAPRHKTSN